MSKNNVIKYVSIILSIMLTTTAFADLIDIDYFNGLDPQKHIRSVYDTDRKKQLDESKITYDDIEDMIHMNNPDILNMWNSWENNKSANDVYDDYMSAADALYSGSGSSEVADAMANAQADAMRILADQNADDSYTNFLTNYLQEKQMVLTTKIMDINYFKSDYDEQMANATLLEARRNVEKAKNAYDVGAGTKLDYLTAKKAESDAESAVINAKSDRNTLKRNLLINCGKSMNDEIIIVPVDTELYFDIATVNLKSDYEKVLNNNIQFAIYKRKRDNARTDEVKNQYDILIEAAPQNIYNDLETKLSNITDAIESYKNKQIAVRLSEDEYKKATNEYNDGSISKKEFLTKEYNLLNAKLALKASVYDLKIAVETYKASLDGYGNC